MKLSHIIIKVNDLHAAVKNWTNKGFVVEYGKAKNPYNALIYFKEGPYIELFQSSGMPAIAKFIFKLTGKKGFIDRFDYWDHHSEGLIGLEVETYKNDFNKESALLDQCGEKYFIMNSHRLDAKSRDLHFTCLFPDNMQIPPFMTYFNIDPKPSKNLHKNGITGIKSVEFETDKKLLPLLTSLCDDPRLIFFEGKGVRNLRFIENK